MFFSVFADDTPVGPNDTSAEVVPDVTAQNPEPEQVKQDEPTAEENTADQIVPQDTTATVQLQTQEEIKPSESAANGAHEKDKADKKEKKKKSAEVVKVESEYLQALVKHASESSKEIANLNAQISDMTIRGVIKNLEDINRFLIENYGDILKSVVIVVLPDGKTYVVKREDLEAAQRFDLEKFAAENKKAIEKTEKQAQEQPESEGKTSEQQEKKGGATATQAAE